MFCRVTLLIHENKQYENNKVLNKNLNKWFGFGLTGCSGAYGHD